MATFSPRTAAREAEDAIDTPLQALGQRQIYGRGTDFCCIAFAGGHHTVATTHTPRESRNLDREADLV